ncbi:MAG: hypothetical protein ACQEP8_00580 [Chlamydiota bacterium]
MWRAFLAICALSAAGGYSEVIDLKYSPKLKVKTILLDHGTRDPTRPIEDIEVKGYTIHDVKIIAGDDKGLPETLVITYHERANYPQVNQGQSNPDSYR